MISGLSLFIVLIALVIILVLVVRFASRHYTIPCRIYVLSNVSGSSSRLKPIFSRLERWVRVVWLKKRVVFNLILYTQNYNGRLHRAAIDNPLTLHS